MAEYIKQGHGKWQEVMTCNPADFENNTIYVPAWYKKLSNQKVPFKISFDLKKRLNASKIKLGSEVTLQDRIYPYKGKITEIDGQKVVVEGTIPALQMINEELDSYYSI